MKEEEEEEEGRGEGGGGRERREGGRCFKRVEIQTHELGHNHLELGSKFGLSVA